MRQGPIRKKMFEGVFFRALQGDVPPALADELRANAHTVEPGDSYPRSTWYEAVEKCSAALYPDSAPEEQRRKLGQLVIHRVQERGLIRRPLMGMVKLFGPRRTLEYAASNSSFGPIGMQIESSSRTSAELNLDDTKQPEFLAGVLEAAIGALGGKEPRVAILGEADGRMRFRAQWR